MSLNKVSDIVLVAAAIASFVMAAMPMFSGGSMENHSFTHGLLFLVLFKQSRLLRK